MTLGSGVIDLSLFWCKGKDINGVCKGGLDVTVLPDLSSYEGECDTENILVCRPKK
jgi:hypothetical protein